VEAASTQHAARLGVGMDAERDKRASTCEQRERVEHHHPRAVTMIESELTAGRRTSRSNSLAIDGWQLELNRAPGVESQTHVCSVCE
jgi:hypothetical protein